MSALSEILNRIILQVWHATGIAEHESCWDEEINQFTITYKNNRYQVLVRKII